MVPKIKICGIQTLEEVDIINLFPIDYAGFLLAPSKRQIPIEHYYRLKKHLRKDIKTVGVFVNESIDTINDFVKKFGIDIVQLHGEETEYDCKNCLAPTWKSVSVESKASLHSMQNYNSVNGYLLDTYSPTLKGGTGNTFNWELVRGLSDNHYIILAGGLNEANILSAIDIVRPQVIDVSSGVEKDSRKNKDFIEKFVRRVKSHEIK